MTQLDIRNWGCIIPTATDDKQMLEKNREFACQWSNFVEST